MAWGLTFLIDLPIAAAAGCIGIIVLMRLVAWRFKMRPAGLRGNTRSGVYHLTGCEWIQKVNRCSLARFFSPDDAELDGFRPCSFCRPWQSSECQKAEFKSGWVMAAILACACSRRTTTVGGTERR